MIKSYIEWQESKPMDRLNDPDIDHRIFFENLWKNSLDERLNKDEGLPYLTTFEDHENLKNKAWEYISHVVLKLYLQ